MTPPTAGASIRHPGQDAKTDRPASTGGCPENQVPMRRVNQQTRRRMLTWKKAPSRLKNNLSENAAENFKQKKTERTESGLEPCLCSLRFLLFNYLPVSDFAY